MSTTKEKYLKAKKNNKDNVFDDHILICERLNGDFVTFGEDAKIISKVCGIPMKYRSLSFTKDKLSEILQKLILSDVKVCLMQYFNQPTLYDLCGYINESKGIPYDLEDVIKKWKFKSCLNDEANPNDIACTNDCDSLYVVINDKGRAVVINKVKY